MRWAAVWAAVGLAAAVFMGVSCTGGGRELAALAPEEGAAVPAADAAAAPGPAPGGAAARPAASPEDAAGDAGEPCLDQEGYLLPSEACLVADEPPAPCLSACAALDHPPGLEVIYAFLDRGDLASADAILEDRWPVPRFAAAPLPRALTWTEDPYGESYWRFVFYGLRPTSHLLWAFRKTGHLAYRDRLVEVLLSFAERGEASPHAADPHATANRAMVVANSYWKLKLAGALPPAAEAPLLALVERTGRFLEAPENFEGDYNHGFAEMAALLVLGESFPDLPRADRWRALARERLDHLLATAVDGDGVAFEQATYYHFYILTQLWEIRRWAARHGVALGERLDRTIAGMIRFGTHVIQPDRQLPMFGAGQGRDMRTYEPALYREMADTDPRFAWVLTAGERGQEPSRRLALFPSSGQAILRSGFGPRAEIARHTWIHFDVGPYRTRHSHLDALSIILYSAGRALLPDSGVFSDDEPRPEYRYFHGTRAHNTVVVDEADQREGGCAAGPAIERDGWVYLSGSHRLYPGVVHGRSVLLLERDLVLVVDRLDGAAPHLYDQTWHLPPDADLLVDAASAAAVAPSGARLLTIHQALADGVTVVSRRGISDPWDGWYSEKENVKLPAHAVRFRKAAASARFVTLLASGPHAAAPVAIVAQAEGAAAEAAICVAGRGWRVALAALGGPVETVEVVGDAGACVPPVAEAPGPAPDEGGGAVETLAGSR